MNNWNKNFEISYKNVTCKLIFDLYFCRHIIAWGAEFALGRAAVNYCDLSVKIKQMFNRNYLHVILRLLFFGYLLFSLSLFLFMYEPCFTYQNWHFWCYDFEIQLEHFEDSIWRFSLAIQIFNGSALVYVSRRKKIF